MTFSLPSTLSLLLGSLLTKVKQNYCFSTIYTTKTEQLAAATKPYVPKWQRRQGTVLFLRLRLHVGKEYFANLLRINQSECVKINVYGMNEMWLFLESV